MRDRTVKQWMKPIKSKAGLGKVQQNYVVSSRLVRKIKDQTQIGEIGSLATFL